MRISHANNRMALMQPQRLKIPLLVFLALNLALGCSGKNLRFKLKRQSTEETLLTALKSDDPDLRYKALSKLSTSQALTQDASVEVVKVIARNDASPLVRGLAVHCLGLIADDRVVDQLVSSMTDPDGRVRSEAAWALAQVPYQAFEQTKKVKQAKETLLKALAEDTTLDVRINSATALASFQDRDVLYGLILALKDQDFAVRYHAERSLVALTGKTFRTDAARWLQWLKATDNPFANAGQIPSELARPKRNVLQKTKDQVYQWYLDWQGPSKK